jgi:Dolichyl-phosphate-mannose-protein mannosyltransferase
LTPARPAAKREHALAGWLGLVAALGICAVTLFWRLGASSLYTDEAYTFALGGLGPKAMIQALTTRDFHPPLFYLAAHAALGLHWPLWEYRYLTAPFGLLTVLATWGAARRMFGPLTAALAAIVVALAPSLLVYDRMFRMYAVLVCLATLSWWLLLEAEHASGGERVLLWTGYAIVCVLLAYTHYLGFFALACQGVYVLTRLRTNRPALFAYGLVVLAYVPWVTHLARQLPLGGIVMSRPGIDAGLASSVRGAYALGLPSWPQSWVSQDLALTILVFAIACVAGWLGWRTALPFWLGCLFLAIAASIIFDKNLAYFSSYLLIDVPPVAIGAALMITTLGSGRARLAGWALALALIGTEALAASNVLLDPYYQFPDWYAVNAVMLRQERAGDAIILDAGYEQYVVQDFSAFRGRTMMVFMNPSDFAPIFAWVNEHPEVRIWYVEHQNFYWDPARRIAGALAQHRRVLAAQSFPRQSAVNEVSVVLFGKVPMNTK